MAEFAYKTGILVTLKPVTCCKCGVAFGISSRLYDELMKSHENFYCPSGHGQHFLSRTEEERLRQELASAKAHSEWLSKINKRKESQIRGLKGSVTKIKKRIGKGVCPCCNRHFENLEKHMSCKHPDYHNEKVK